MREKDVVRCRTENGIARLELNRPDCLNAMNRQLLRQLLAALDWAAADDAAQAVLLTGNGRAFSAGADIRYLNRASAAEVRELARLAVAATEKIENLGKPVLAAINGDALGGGLEIAEACMLRLAAPHARFGHPEVKIGAVAGFGGTTRLPRLIGKGRAAELLLTGRLIDADEACRLGLINRVAAAESLLAESEALLREVMAQSPSAVRLSWEAIHRGLSLSEAESARLGADYFGLVAQTEDFRIGTKAFLEKALPRFKGR
ncbi:enoyl-CoA hydratase/isomerase family protein [Chromobacterium sp. IIBBL 290-4]|uniref:enoyl-CoA hydratase/isomerase family protein n=1 Tax=Chromobacterium sp. IIBBL 290-4 TaxID=2953890 RepID=UPI0020B86CF3|nr:enoyl-CoA hydratase-related protein [Chromobacterium sp. IIBBL 290-4]UTH74520.1 enoyl-CoA hydratase-related protein [Chromobacterium sp. IIBBL 290-4]